MSGFLTLAKDSYDGYSPKELARGSWLHKTDMIGVPTFAALYLLVMTCVVWDHAGDGADQTSVEPPMLALLCSFSFATITCIVLYQHCFVAPYPTEDTVEMFAVMTYVGRWIFLTRQTLCLQALHAVFSLASRNPTLSAMYPTLVPGTHAMAVLVNGLGIFVMVQYFSLVASHPDFKEQSRVWTARGVPFSPLMHFLHTPCGVLAFLDLVVCKHRTLLEAQTPPFSHLLGMYFIYVVLYVSLVLVNNAASGHYPYGFMKALGHDPVKWVKFIAAQFGILAVFILVALASVTYAPRMW